MGNRPERKAMSEMFRRSQQRQRKFKPNWSGILMLLLVVCATIGLMTMWIVELVRAVLACTG